jgi:uncharacterized protein DUF1844
MPDEKNEDQGFKVVDRRSFTADGARRETSAEQKAAKAESSRPSPPRPDPAVVEAEERESLEETGSGFETLVSYLSTTAMFQLGLLPGPGGERIPSDLVNAQRTIDLLEVLQQKTRGNLTLAESKLLEDVLYELRMSYVEIEKRLAKKVK